MVYTRSSCCAALLLPSDRTAESPLPSYYRYHSVPPRRTAVQSLCRAAVPVPTCSAAVVSLPRHRAHDPQQLWRHRLAIVTPLPSHLRRHHGTTVPPRDRTNAPSRRRATVPTRHRTIKPSSHRAIALLCRCAFVPSRRHAALPPRRRAAVVLPMPQCCRVAAAQLYRPCSAARAAAAPLQRHRCCCITTPFCQRCYALATTCHHAAAPPQRRNAACRRLLLPLAAPAASSRARCMPRACFQVCHTGSRSSVAVATTESPGLETESPGSTWDFDKIPEF